MAERTAEPQPEDFPSVAAYRYALIEGGASELEADRLAREAFERFREQVRHSDASEYPSAEHYLYAMTAAQLTTAEIDQRMESAKRRLKEQREANDVLLRARRRYEQELELEESRVESASEVLRSRHRLDIDEYPEATQADVERIRQRLSLDYASDGLAFDRYESERQSGLRGWVQCP